MSYNLNTKLLKINNNKKDILKKMSDDGIDQNKFIIFFLDDHLKENEFNEKFFNFHYDQFHNEYSEDMKNKNKIFFEKLKDKFKCHILSLSLPILDFKPNFLMMTDEPDDYERIHIYNDDKMATYIKKSFILENKDNYSDLIMDSKFNEGDVIFVYDPYIMERNIEVIAFNVESAEYTASFLNRDLYHNYVPYPISESWWNIHFGLEKNEFDLLKNEVVKNAGKRTKMNDWLFDESENILLIVN